MLVNVLRRTTLGDKLARSPLRPQYWTESWKAARTLWFEYGHLRTVQSKAAVDRNGRPLPWYTFPAIEYLTQFDFSAASVFEYGSGNSTLFWGERAARVVSVEDDERWFAKNRTRVPPNCTLILEPDLDKYVAVIDRFAQPFDIIVVDGPARGLTRLKCAARAIERLRAGGLVILDNADWLPESARLLRESGLLQVDMSGFIPIAGHTQTTSLFFHRSCELRPTGGRQPQPSVAAQLKIWEPGPSAPAPPAGPHVNFGGTIVSSVVATLELTKMSPAGPRVFDVAFQQAAGTIDIFIYDRSAARLVDGPHGLTAGTSLREEQARLDAMTWDDFCEFVRRSPMRRYLLKDLPELT
jgi:hypothetical protein